VLPRASAIRIDTSVLAFTFAVATATGILLGLAPAWHLVTGNVNSGLQEGARGVSDGGRGWLRRSLLVAEIALSLVLLVGAGLMVKSMYRLLNVDSGFDAEGVLTMQINLPAQRYVDPELERQQSPAAYSRAAVFFADLIDRVRHLPGARAAGAISGLPLMGENWGKNLTFYDRPLPRDINGLPPIQYRVVAGDYFQALGIRILSGRAFSDSDTVAAPKVAIVNRELVKRHWDGKSPLGRIISVNPPLQVLPKAIVEEAMRAGHIRPGYEPDKFTVVGVADDARYASLERSPLPLVYVPYAQGAEGTLGMLLVVRADGDPLALAGLVREQVAQIDREQPVADIRTMQARVASSVAQKRMQLNVLGAFASMAILLAAIGIYGVMSYWVTQRSREIGIRLALGAARSDVTGLVLFQGLKLTIVGVGLGVVGALLITRVLRTLLFSVSVTDPFVFTAIVVVLTGTAALATYLPARRAARLDPFATLRSE
jgi:putative ABC transport system permease protein